MSEACSGLESGLRGAHQDQGALARSLSTRPEAPVQITATACADPNAGPERWAGPDIDGFLVLTWPPSAWPDAFAPGPLAACAPGTLWIHDLRSAPPPPPSRPAAGRPIAVHLSRDAIDGLADRAGVSRIADLRRSPEPQPDPVAGNIAAMLLPHFDAAGRSPVFVDNLLLALGVHVLRTYGKTTDDRPVVAGGLEPWQEDRAKAFMLERLEEALSIDRVAEVCGLSSSRFSRAFRATTGRPPYRWYLEQRIERAKTLLADGDAPLLEIALACGFSDQSQFTVAFGRIAGMSPGAWRRQIEAAR